MPRILLSLFYCVATCVQASAFTISLDEIGPRVRASQPTLKAARLAVAEARGRHLGAGRLTNPTLEASFQNESRVSPRATVIAVDQAFPITRRLSLEKRMTSQLVVAAELEVRDAERRLIAEAQVLAVQLLALNKQRILREQQAALATKLYDFAQGRANAGELSPLDAAQARVDAHRLLLEKQKLETLSVSFLGQLKPMLGLQPADSLSIAGNLPPLATPNVGADWSRRADYQLAETKLAAALTGANLAEARKWQDVSAGFFAAREQQDVTPDQTERTGYVGFRASLPLPFWSRNQGEIAEKAASADRARLEREALGSQIISEAETARREMLANASLASATREQVLPLVLEQASKLEKAFEAGQIDLITVLRARDQRLQLEATVLDAERDFHLARIRYEAAIGKHAPAATAAPAKALHRQGK